MVKLSLDSSLNAQKGLALTSCALRIVVVTRVQSPVQVVIPIVPPCGSWRGAAFLICQVLADGHCLNRNQSSLLDEATWTAAVDYWIQERSTRIL